MDKVISLITPSRNNLKYLKWAYTSIRKNLGYIHEICMADDASTEEFLLISLKKIGVIKQEIVDFLNCKFIILKETKVGYDEYIYNNTQ